MKILVSILFLISFSQAQATSDGLCERLGMRSQAIQESSTWTNYTAYNRWSALERLGIQKDAEIDGRSECQLQSLSYCRVLESNIASCSEYECSALALVVGCKK